MCGAREKLDRGSLEDCSVEGAEGPRSSWVPSGRGGTQPGDGDGDWRRSGASATVSGPVGRSASLVQGAVRLPPSARGRGQALGRSGRSSTASVGGSVGCGGRLFVKVGRLSHGPQGLSSQREGL